MKQKKVSKISVTAATAPMREKRPFSFALVEKAGWGLLALAAVLTVMLQLPLFIKLGERALCYADWAGFVEMATYPVPGGTLQWVANYCAVLFHVPWVGCGVFFLLAAGVIALGWRWAKLPLLVACLPVLHVLLSVTYCGFSVWIFKNAAFPQAFLLEWAVALCAFGAVKRSAWGVLTVALYPFTGISVLFGLLGGAMLPKKAWWVRGACLTLAVGAFCIAKLAYADPAWAALFLGHQWMLAEEGACVWNLLAIGALVCVFGAEWLRMKPLQKHLLVWVPCAMALGFAALAWGFADPSNVLYPILKCERNLRRGDGQLAMTLPEKAVIKHRMLSAYYIHSIWRAGQMEDKLFDMPWLVSHKSSTIDTMSLDGFWLLYQYGIVQMARRWCYESVIKLGWNAEYYDLLAQIAIVCNEMPLAERYARQLMRIPLRASEGERLLSYAQGAPIAQTDNLWRVADLHLRLSADAGSPTFEAGTKLEDGIYNRYAVLKNGNRDMVALYLCASLLLRDTTAFTENFNVILSVWPQRPLPRVFQQALLAAASTLPPEKQPHLTQDLFTPGMVEAFSAFQKEAPKADPLNEAFRKRFGKSYWYYASFLQ